MIGGRFDQCPVHKISANDTNKFVLLCEGSQVNFVSVIEIFDQGGKTPPNQHAEAYEYFYVLYGEGKAIMDGTSIPIGQGSYFIVPPGANHEVHNTGNSRLYVLTTMVPDEAFSDLIRRGPTTFLDEEDIRILSSLR